MYTTRFFMALILVVLYSTTTVWAAPIGSNIRTPYIIGLRSIIRLPVFYDDTSTLRFVSRTTPLSNISYAPTDLVSISWALIDQAGRSSQLRQVARDALWKMAKGFQLKFWVPLVVISGYRSAVYQKRLWDLGRCTDSLCAPPGYSEHQLGLSVDLLDATSDAEFQSNTTYVRYIKWLQTNAHIYGWTQSYQKWVEIDEYEIEPWHYRYLWVNLASRLHTLGWTYTEFVRFQEAMARR